MNITHEEIDNAVARLVQAKCMLAVTAKRHSEIVVDSEEWEVNEALRGVMGLLDGCAETLGKWLDRLPHGREG
jgi:hypothetical protein